MGDRLKTVENSTLLPNYTGFARIKLFLALSRTPHGLIDMSTPAFCALLWLAAFPPLNVVLLGMITAFAGYTAVYALNDVIDYRVDRENLPKSGIHSAENDLDAVMIRHPMAQGYLTFKAGLVWSAAWAAIALVGAYMLNPICVLFFLIGCVLETVYCLMLKISYLRVIVSGVVKTLGGMAAVFAVDPNPSYGFLMILFFCLFFWEIGGQNIPNDWTDLKEDKALKARTIPVRYGAGRARIIVLDCLFMAVGFSLYLFSISRLGSDIPIMMIVLMIGFYLLILPGWRLYQTKARREAMRLFNKASYYPLALLGLVVFWVIIF